MVSLYKRWQDVLRFLNRLYVMKLETRGEMVQHAAKGEIASESELD